MFPKREQQKVLCAQQKLGRWLRNSLVAELQQAVYQSLIPKGATAHSTNVGSEDRQTSLTHMTHKEMHKTVRALTAQQSCFLTGIFSLKDLRVIQCKTFTIK